MFQGNWTCSKCGGAIKELPFEPRSNSGLTCRECYFKEKDGNAPAPVESAPEMSASEDIPDFDPTVGSISSEPAPPPPDSLDGAVPAAERQMIQGQWKCASCGGEISQLPFQPKNTENLKCLDCFKKSKA